MIGPRALVSVIVLPVTVAVVFPWLLVGRIVVPTGIALIGLIPLALGVALSAWCVVVFATRGRGTLAPWDPPRRFVATGPYRVVRNPMYLGVGSVVLAEAILFSSWSIGFYLVAVALLWHLFVVAYEEPTLERQFGEEYRAYRARVSRWLPRRVTEGQR